MYRVKVEVRADMLGWVRDTLYLNIDDCLTRHESMRKAEVQAHKEKCLSYGCPVHFVAVKAQPMN